MEKSRTYKLCLTALTASLIAVAAFLKIPVPVIPITIQTQVVLMAGLIAGPKVGTCAAGVYILMGLIGLPVFTQGGGVHYVLNPTFGYLLGFIGGAFVSGFVFNKKKTAVSGFLGAYIGLAVIYVFGIAYLYIISRTVLMASVSLKATVLAAALPLVKDIPFTAAAVVYAMKIRRYIEG